MTFHLNYYIIWDNENEFQLFSQISEPFRNRCENMHIDTTLYSILKNSDIKVDPYNPSIALIIVTYC